MTTNYSSQVLPFTLDFELADLEKVSFKYTRQTTETPENGPATVVTETKKKPVSIITAGASKHQVLHCINELNAAKVSLRWTTGPKLYENIVDILQSHSDITVWNVNKAARICRYRSIVLVHNSKRCSTTHISPSNIYGALS